MLICILGRQPRLGLAELEALFGAPAVKPLGTEAALLDIPLASITHKNLGSVIKVSEVATIVPSADWREVSARSLVFLTDMLSHREGGKISFGISAYGSTANPKQLSSLAFELKKSLKENGRSVRTIPNTTSALNSAQVLHNNLDRGTNAEILLVCDKRQTYIALTRSVQNVASYSRRDFERPKRDARVGMLPPKLAQIMINLAKPAPGTTVLDPFCGTGVVLMEAALQGYGIEGSDLNPKMIEYTTTNLEWLSRVYRTPPANWHLQTADATSQNWGNAIQSVVCETYLGRPLVSLPNHETMSMIIADCNTIIRKFLINLRPQLAETARCCVAVPAWATQKGFLHLPLVDDLEDMGYNRIRFSYATFDELIYHRSDQIVARELLVLTPRKE